MKAQGPPMGSRKKNKYQNKLSSRNRPRKSQKTNAETSDLGPSPTMFSHRKAHTNDKSQGSPKSDDNDANIAPTMDQHQSTGVIGFSHIQSKNIIFSKNSFPILF